LGLDNAGKTVTSRCLVGAWDPKLPSAATDTAPTIGFTRVSTRYKGFTVDIYDVGGSRTFRGIWPKYYHEVHGYIFVVDATSNDERMTETGQVLADILSHDTVQGKPILLFGNKADDEEARDENQIVEDLDVEKLVNQAKCPTRVELSVATQNEGLREGFKWLIKTIIASLPELGPRVARDVEREKQTEERRRIEIRKKMEEKRKAEDKEQEIVEDGSPLPGFVPISEAVKNASEEAVKSEDPKQDTEVRVHEESSMAKQANSTSSQSTTSTRRQSQASLEDYNHSDTSRQSSIADYKTRLDLEPILYIKKKSVLRTLSSAKLIS